MSGKKKQNTIKFTKVCDQRGRTLGDVTFRPGRMHDQTALQTDGIDDLLEQFPDVGCEMDAGYRGLHRDHPGQVSVPPKKPGKDAAPEVTGAWDQARHAQSSRRICVEHAIAEQQALAAAAALARAARGPARDRPGDRLPGVRPRRRLVTRRYPPITPAPQARTPRA